jgi:hypothetical protein
MPNFDGGSLDYKQHLNLSIEASNVVENDMSAFDVKSRSTFLNRIFTNFYEDAEASISIRCEQEKERLLRVLDSLPESMQSKALNLLTKDFQTVLQQKVAYYPKSSGFKFRINQRNFRYLTEDTSYPEEKFYERMGQYFKAVIEEYACKPYRDREKIYFSEIFGTIEMAIGLERQISMVLSQGATHCISPYKIESDPLSMYHYLIGKKLQLNETEHRLPGYFSYRITNIKEIKLLKSKRGHLTKDEKHWIDNELLRKGVQFMSSETSKICVRFTSAGLVKYRRLLHLRPPYSEVLDENTYVFHCTETQAEFYFFKFGEDAQIVEPVSLAQKFERMYINAANCYTKK